MMDAGTRCIIEEKIEKGEQLLQGEYMLISREDLDEIACEDGLHNVLYLGAAEGAHVAYMERRQDLDAIAAPARKIRALADMVRVAASSNDYDSIGEDALEWCMETVLELAREIEEIADR